MRRWQQAVEYMHVDRVNGIRFYNFMCLVFPPTTQLASVQSVLKSIDLHIFGGGVVPLSM